MTTREEITLGTERLVLRPFRPTDIDAIMTYHALPDVQRYLDWKARDRVEVKAALDAMVRQNRLTRPGDILHFAATRRDSGHLIGQVSLRWTDATAGQAEVRFILAPEHRGNGLATEAVRAVMDHGFDALRFHRIFARCAGKNRASARLLTRLGMRLEAHYREHALFMGEWDEELHFAVLDREWGESGNVRAFPARPPRDYSRPLSA